MSVMPTVEIPDVNVCARGRGANYTAINVAHDRHRVGGVFPFVLCDQSFYMA